MGQNKENVLKKRTYLSTKNIGMEKCKMLVSILHMQMFIYEATGVYLYVMKGRRYFFPFTSPAVLGFYTLKSEWRFILPGCLQSCHSNMLLVLSEHAQEDRKG